MLGEVPAGHGPAEAGGQGAGPCQETLPPGHCGEDQVGYMMMMMMMISDDDNDN